MLSEETIAVYRGIVYWLLLWAVEVSGSSPEGCQYPMRLDRLHSTYPSLRSSLEGIVYIVIRAAEHTGIQIYDGCSLQLCLATPSVASAGICPINKINSIAWLYRGPSQRIVTITLHCSTLYITLHYCNVFYSLSTSQRGTYCTRVVQSIHFPSWQSWK